jgi:hypothetical protein
MDDAELQNLVVFNNIVSDSLFFEPDMETPKQWSKHLPDYSIKSFIDSLEALTDTTFYINNATKEVYILSNDAPLGMPSVMDLEQWRTAPFQKKRISNKSGRSWSWAKPDSDEFAIEADLNNLVVSATVSTYEDLPAPSSELVDAVYLVANTSTYYRYKQAGTEEAPTYSVERYATPCGSLKTKQGTYNKSIGFYPLPMEVYANSDYEIVIPRTDQDQLMTWNATHRDFAPTLLYYRGMVECNPDAAWTHETTYPLGSAYIKDVFGNDIQGATRQMGTEHLEAQTPLHRQWSDTANEYITTRIDLLPYRHLMQLAFYKKYTFKGLDIILNEIKITADNLGVSQVEIGGYRV